MKKVFRISALIFSVVGLYHVAVIGIATKHLNTSTYHYNLAIIYVGSNDKKVDSIVAVAINYKHRAAKTLLFLPSLTRPNFTP